MEISQNCVAFSDYMKLDQADEAISDFREPLTTADYCQVIARKAKPHGVRRNLRRAVACGGVRCVRPLICPRGRGLSTLVRGPP